MRVPTIRAFLALSPGDAIEAEIDEKWSILRRKRLPVRWVPRENLHVTLCFLGDITQSLCTAVEEAVGAVASAAGPFDAVLGDAGAFPRIEAPRVLWVGLGEGGDAIRNLARVLDDALASLGFGGEKRFHPHITVGRVKAPLPAKILDQIDGIELDPLRFAARAILLMRSTLTADGAKYDVIRKFDLTGESRPPRSPRSVPGASP